MISFQVDLQGTLEVMNGMIHKISHFKRVDVGYELSSWQTEEMHRERPFTKRNRGQGSAATLIRPHSRFEVNRSRTAQRRLARRAKRKSFTGSSEYRKWSTRPILRAELWDKLVERMVDAFRTKLTWKSK
jgi:hypothetical protein